MATKTSTIFVCSKCDAQSSKWTGQCLECGAWGTLSQSRPDYNPAKSFGAASPAGHAIAPTPLSAIAASAERRLSTGIAELDRVFGGGVVESSVTLLGGEPGIGKSTIALMAAAKVADAGKKVIYVSGEESAGQVKMRADRLGAKAKSLLFLNAVSVDDTIATLQKEAPALAVIDSVQTLVNDDLPADAGSVSQVRGATSRLVQFAKQSKVPLLLIGHVTKDGHVAGPKTLEHLVDAVFSFEGERSHPLRVLRSLKNRFGTTDESGLFSMTEKGLEEVKNPSAYLLDERRPGTAGSVICCLMEGTRPVLVEIQALVQKSGFGYPVRRASGFDGQRLEMLAAVISKRAEIDLSTHDIYLNIVGGLKIKEPAADLAVALAIMSSHANASLPPQFAAWGEVGLAGEVRSVVAAERRLAEAANLGIGHVATSLPKKAQIKKPAKLVIHPLSTLSEAAGIFEKK